MSTEAQVLFYAPSLSGDTRIEEAISIAGSQLSSDSAAWGAQLGNAIACLAAHMLLMSPTVANGGDGLSRGTLTSEKSGKDALSFTPIRAEAMSMQEADLSRTAAGMALLGIQRSRANFSFGVLI